MSRLVAAAKPEQRNSVGSRTTLDLSITMGKRAVSAPHGDSKLELLTKEALLAHKTASNAKEKVRRAKLRLKTAKQSLKAARRELKAARKAARKAAKKVKRGRVNRPPKHKKSRQRRAQAPRRGSS